MLARELLRNAASQLELAGCDAPRRDADLMLMTVWGLSTTSLMIRLVEEVPIDIAASFETLLQRRLAREPLAYILGEKEFWSLTFKVTPDVLIPRPETEHLIEVVQQYYPNPNAPLAICDIGTGSGCIAITLAHEYANASVTACDISDKAIAVAKMNADNLGVTGRMHFYAGSLYQALPEPMQFDVIVSNPPYVSLDEMDALEAELGFEPRSALTDEDTGLTLLAGLLKDADLYLKANGMLFLESGLCGMPDTPTTLEKVNDYFDLAGNFRGSIFRKI